MNKAEKKEMFCLQLTGSDIDTYYKHLMSAVHTIFSKKEHKLIRLAQEERLTILGKLIGWWNNDKVALREEFSHFTKESLRGVINVLAYIVIAGLTEPDDETKEAIRELIADLDRYNMPLFVLAPFRTRFDLTDLEASQMILSGITSSDREIVNESATSIYIWSVAAKQGLVSQLPFSLLDALVGRALMRTPVGLDTILMYLGQLIRVIPEQFTDTHIQYLAIALEHLLPETDLAARTNQKRLLLASEQTDMPETRRYAANLSIALSNFLRKKGAQIPSICGAWDEAIKVDPLPEIRFLS